MKSHLILGILLSTTSLHAGIIKSKVHSVDAGMIKFENGRVAFMENVSPEIEAQDYLEAQVDDRSTLLSFKKILPPHISHDESKFVEMMPPLFEPSVVPDMDAAWKIFHRSNPNYKRISECSDRAHVWAHDEYKNTGTKSMKAFVFFTNPYINAVRFKWWFHVAPMYRVNVKGTIQDLVMDFRYADRPLTVREWTDLFVYTKQPCKVSTKFSEYDKSQLSESCLLIFESMHYRIPAEIHDQELKGKYKTTTTDAELKETFRYAFEN